MRLSHFAVPAALGASLVVGLAGCESQRSDEPLAYENKPLRGEARHDVPAGATVVKEGHEPLLFQAPGDGTVWVYNASDNRLVYTAGVRAGQNVAVDPDHDFVTVDGKKVVDMKMDDFDKHQILFSQSSSSSSSSSPPMTATPAAGTITVQPNPVTIQQQPAEIRVKPGNEVEVQPSGVKVEQR